jgi:hypothetical protein
MDGDRVNQDVARELGITGTIELCFVVSDIRPTLSGLLETELVADPSYRHEGSKGFPAWDTPGFASAADSLESTEVPGTNTQFGEWF